MTLLTIAKSAAINVGAAVPVSVLAGSSADNIKLIEYSQETAIELARRVDWSALRTVTTITGTGSNDDFDLPAGFARLTSGLSVTVGGVPIRGGVSQDEWRSLTPIVGTPRYYRLSGDAISFYPYPTDGLEISLSWQTKNWCSSGGEIWADDSDTALVPEDLIVKGTIWRWKRQMGANFQDYLAEFESALSELAKSDDGVRSP